MVNICRKYSKNPIKLQAQNAFFRKIMLFPFFRFFRVHAYPTLMLRIEGNKYNNYNGIRARFLGETTRKTRKTIFLKSEWTMTRIGIRALYPTLRREARSAIKAEK